jgi:hypothetical protein
VSALAGEDGLGLGQFVALRDDEPGRVGADLLLLGEDERQE